MKFSLTYLLIVFIYWCSLCLSQNTNSIAIDSSSAPPTVDQSTNFIVYTPFQDSNFIRDSRLKIDFIYWLMKGLDRSEGLWQDLLLSYSNTPGNYLSSTFQRMPSNVFEPLPNELVQHRIGIINALSVPGIYNHNISGINFNLRDVATFLGMLEDVSPEIKYQLNVTADVEIVIFNVSAIAVAKIFSGTQKPGKYTIFWNGKDDAGKKVRNGDYIAEVRIGQQSFVRKRIVIE